MSNIELLYFFWLALNTGMIVGILQHIKNGQRQEWRKQDE